MLEPILQQVGAGNPQLAQLIGQHPEQFLQLLSEDGENDAPLPPGAQAISVTEEERAAIERVSLLPPLITFKVLKIAVMSPRFPTGPSNPSIFRLRQERRASCKLPI
jgi:hypothetical protein